MTPTEPISTAESKRQVPTPEEWRAKGCCGCEEFQDLSCGYRGDESWCDHTRARCKEIGNLERFDGAMPDLPEEGALTWLDTLVIVLTLTCWWFEWPWLVAVPVYTVSSAFFIPPVRQEVILWFTLRRQQRDGTLPSLDSGSDTKD